MYRTTLDEVLETGRFGPFAVGGSVEEAKRILGEMGDWDWFGTDDPVSGGWFGLEDFELHCYREAPHPAKIGAISIRPGATRHRRFSGGGIVDMDSGGIFVNHKERNVVRKLTKFCLRLDPPGRSTLAVYKVGLFGRAVIHRPDRPLFQEGLYSFEISEPPLPLAAALPTATPGTEP